MYRRKNGERKKRREYEKKATESVEGKKKKVSALQTTIVNRATFFCA